MGDDKDGVPASRTDSENRNREYHGTAMLSLVTGKGLGVSKKVKPYIVRLPAGTFQYDERQNLLWQGGFTPEDFITAFGMVNDALGTQNRDLASSVVLVSHYYPREELVKKEVDIDAFSRRLWELINAMTRKGAVVVTGTGTCIFQSPVSC